LLAALRAAMAVRAGDLAQSLRGPALGEAVRKARITAIAAATGKH
jgi:tRNA nucleotidyltransferase (CCA-adding enzyme)